MPSLFDRSGPAPAVGSTIYGVDYDADPMYSAPDDESGTQGDGFRSWPVEVADNSSWPFALICQDPTGRGEPAPGPVAVTEGSDGLYESV